MTSSKLPPIEMLRQLLDYDRETGILTWKKRDPDLFNGGKRSKQWSANSWNTKFAGKVAFTRISVRDGNKYYGGSVLNVSIEAHIAAWAIENGRWPTLVIDHIDGNSLRNAAENLRDVPQKVNASNCRMSKNNTSGFNGVSLDAQTGRWQAFIKVNFKRINLGRYVNFDDAVAARERANMKYGFSERHGKAVPVVELG